MNRSLKKSFFRGLLAVSLVISPVLAIADVISMALEQNQAAALEMPCHQAEQPADGADASESRSTPTSAPCSCCDQFSCLQNKTCHDCVGGGHFTALLADPLEYVAVPAHGTVGLAGEHILDFNSPPLLPPPLPPYTS